MAIFCGLILGAGLFLALPAARSLTLARPVLIAVALALGLGIVGLVDDVRALSRTFRVVMQAAAAVVAWYAGFRVHATSSQALNMAITIVWIIGITNAFNLLDNMDGLSAGLAGVAAVAFSAMGILGHQAAIAILSGALGGAALGFVGHNRYPAKIFMGDAGSLFLGFLLALIGVRLRFPNVVEVTFLVPVVVLGLPIFDTTLVVLSRLRAGRRPFTGGRDHVSHRLIKVGLPVETAIGLLYWSGLCLGWLGFVISRSTTSVGWMLLGFVVALGIFFGTLLLKVPVYEDAAPAPRRGLNYRARRGTRK
ncbi:MAG TPA: MraY family glycosyltransferase [Actinomycetota bacterium]|nr:MraY family glycosyltransferase [Actinomycetota bacterium]